MLRSPETLRAALPVLAIVVSAVSIGAVLVAAAAAGTLGYDYACCYDVAARRVLSGGPIYDLSFTQSGPGGLFDYPPPFLALVLPFAVGLSPSAAAAAWTGAMVVSFLVGVALMPVRREVRWLTLLLGSLSWPVVYSLKLGQVGGLLVLLFAIAWR
ncbi:MAG TPA: glycosyltransferase 87 family protein, partial [Candidatus Limnocylindrales bacterium]|nr:glycosyltransferase 87 family protein [Candidatus Limnocylindrales bacterium]